MKFPGPPGIDVIPTDILSTWPPVTDKPISYLTESWFRLFDILLFITSIHLGTNLL